MADYFVILRYVWNNVSAPLLASFLSGALPENFHG